MGDPVLATYQRLLCHSDPTRTILQSLKTDNTRLRDEVERLRRIVEDHGGQLKVLTTFVQSALDERTDTKVEKAVAREMERLVKKRLPSPDSDR